MQLTTIGFIGLGNMGSAIAQRIIKGGFTTVLYARDEKDVAAFRGQPIKIVGTIKELSAASDLIGVYVFDDKDVNDVVLGEDCRKLNIPETIIDSNAKRAFAVVSNELQNLAGLSAPKDG